MPRASELMPLESKAECDQAELARLSVVRGRGAAAASWPIGTLNPTGRSDLARNLQGPIAFRVIGPTIFSAALSLDRKQRPAMMLP